MNQKKVKGGKLKKKEKEKEREREKKMCVFEGRKKILGKIDGNERKNLWRKIIVKKSFYF